MNIKVIAIAMLMMHKTILLLSDMELVYGKKCIDNRTT